MSFSVGGPLSVCGHILVKRVCQYNIFGRNYASRAEQLVVVFGCERTHLNCSIVDAAV